MSLADSFEPIQNGKDGQQTTGGLLLSRKMDVKEVNHMFRRVFRRDFEHEKFQWFRSLRLTSWQIRFLVGISIYFETYK